MTASDGIGLDDVPWAAIRRLTDYLRKRFYTVPWPEDKTCLVVDRAPQELEHILRERGCFEAAPESYDYEGADLDLRRPWGRAADGTPLELHVRGREPPDEYRETHLIAHIEASRYEARQAHVDGHLLEWGEAIGALRRLLEDHLDLQTAVHER